MLWETGPTGWRTAHLLQQPALLAQVGLHLPDDLLEPAPLLLHVPLLQAQPLLQRWGGPQDTQRPPTCPLSWEGGGGPCGTSELPVLLPDAQLPLLGGGEVRGLHPGGQRVQAAGELLHLLDDAIQGPGEDPVTLAWGRQHCPWVGRARTSHIPRVGGGTGDSIDLAVLQQLQPLQLVLMVLAHLQDGGPAAPREGGLWAASREERASGAVFQASLSSPGTASVSLAVSLNCLGALMPHPPSKGMFLPSFTRRKRQACLDSDKC